MNEGKDMSTRCAFVFCLLLFVAGVMCAISHAGQTEKATADEWWINLPSSPLRITRNASGRVVIISNMSSASINQYQLGCATIEPGKVNIKRKMKAQTTNLLPADSVKGEVYFESLDSRENYKELCEQESAKLTVIKASFTDGSVWKVKD